MIVPIADLVKDWIAPDLEGPFVGLEMRLSIPNKHFVHIPTDSVGPKPVLVPNLSSCNENAAAQAKGLADQQQSLQATRDHHSSLMASVVRQLETVADGIKWPLSIQSVARSDLLKAPRIDLSLLVPTSGLADEGLWTSLRELLRDINTPNLAHAASEQAELLECIVHSLKANQIPGMEYSQTLMQLVQQLGEVVKRPTLNTLLADHVGQQRRLENQLLSLEKTRDDHLAEDDMEKANLTTNKWIACSLELLDSLAAEQAAVDGQKLQQEDEVMQHLEASAINGIATKRKDLLRRSTDCDEDSGAICALVQEKMSKLQSDTLAYQTDKALFDERQDANTKQQQACWSIIMEQMNLLTNLVDDQTKQTDAYVSNTLRLEHAKEVTKYMLLEAEHYKSDLLRLKQTSLAAADIWRQTDEFVAKGYAAIWEWGASRAIEVEDKQSLQTQTSQQVSSRLFKELIENLERKVDERNDLLVKLEKLQQWIVRARQQRSKKLKSLVNEEVELRKEYDALQTEIDSLEENFAEAEKTSARVWAGHDFNPRAVLQLRLDQLANNKLALVAYSSPLQMQQSLLLEGRMAEWDDDVDCNSCASFSIMSESRGLDRF
eukprot:NODE_475_length_2183_cov_140.074903_g439_i0.p1 GENE.NODE_475_length_2183_cov_140.074903_g439_i0~~NODE_475_length_2183_cov_140.074903_g439_i0.p1  ORF type:complete len:678 (-),score=170.75 NODE_475_length_2183_cov_140.074903_g439_i0:148-1962(-)